MKTKNLFVVIAVLATTMMLSSCGDSKEEQTKMISPDRVNLVGTHSNVLEVTDSVKVLLVKVDNNEKKWTIKAIVPISNTTFWKNVPGTNTKAKEYFTSSMGNACSSFIDANDSEVLGGGMQWDKLESILSANEYKTVKLELQARYSLFSEYEVDYKTAKAAFDKIDGMELSKLDLTKEWRAEETSTSHSSSKSYDVDLDDAIDQYERAVDAASKALDMLDRL